MGRFNGKIATLATVVALSISQRAQSAPPGQIEVSPLPASSLPPGLTPEQLRDVNVRQLLDRVVAKDEAGFKMRMRNCGACALSVDAMINGAGANSATTTPNALGMSNDQIAAQYGNAPIENFKNAGALEAFFRGKPVGTSAIINTLGQNGAAGHAYNVVVTAQGPVVVDGQLNHIGNLTDSLKDPHFNRGAGFDVVQTNDRGGWKFNPKQSMANQIREAIAALERQIKSGRVNGPAACERGSGAPPAPGASLRGQLGKQAGGTAIGAAAAGAGRLVEGVTGDPRQGLATTVGIGAVAVAATAKGGARVVIKGVGGGLIPGLVGSGTREVARRSGQVSEANADRIGYGAAGATGAGIGAVAGPPGAMVGAAVAVTGMAAADGATAGADWILAVREGRSLDEQRQLSIIYRNFGAIQNRDLAHEPLTNLPFWKKMVAKPGGDAEMRRLLAQPGGRADDVVGKIYQEHFGRPPTVDELNSARSALQGGGHLATVEDGVMQRANP